MSSSTIDRAELEDRVRAALAARARSTVVDVPDRFTLGAFVPPGSGRSRRTLLVAAAALVVVVLGVAALLIRDDGINSETAEAPESPARGTEVHGPTGSRWFVLNLPGVAPESSHRESTPAVPGGRPDLQAFRTDAGFDGPIAWVEPVGGSSPDGATEVTVHGEPAYIRESGDVVTLATAREDGFHITAAHMSVDDVVAFADGLQAHDGGGWDATVLPGGLVEVTEEAPPQAASEHAEWDYTGTDGANYELFVNPGGQATFESWARELVSSGGEVAAVSVDGRPGVVIEGPGETSVVWRPTDDVEVDFRTSLDRDGLLSAMEALVPVGEDIWAQQFDEAPVAGG